MTKEERTLRFAIGIALDFESGQNTVFMFKRGKPRGLGWPFQPKIVLEFESLWKESHIAVLLSMKTQTYQVDPNVELPDFLQEVSIAKKLAEIGKVAGENPKSEERSAEESSWQRPEMLGKDVIASSETWEQFGPKVASAAWLLASSQRARRCLSRTDRR